MSGAPRSSCQTRVWAQFHLWIKDVAFAFPPQKTTSSVRIFCSFWFLSAFLNHAGGESDIKYLFMLFLSLWQLLLCTFCTKCSQTFHSVPVAAELLSSRSGIKRTSAGFGVTSPGNYKEVVPPRSRKRQTRCLELSHCNWIGGGGCQVWRHENVGLGNCRVWPGLPGFALWSLVAGHGGAFWRWRFCQNCSVSPASTKRPDRCGGCERCVGCSGSGGSTSCTDWLDQDELFFYQPWLFVLGQSSGGCFKL